MVFFAVESIENGIFFDILDRLATEWGGGTSNHLARFSAGSAVLYIVAIGIMKLTVISTHCGRWDDEAHRQAHRMAIANANAIAVLALNQIFFQPELKAQQVIGLMISIAGVGGLNLMRTSARLTDDSAAEPSQPAN